MAKKKNKGMKKTLAFLSIFLFFIMMFFGSGMLSVTEPGTVSIEGEVFITMKNKHDIINWEKKYNARGNNIILTADDFKFNDITYKETSSRYEGIANFQFAVQIGYFEYVEGMSLALVFPEDKIVRYYMVYKAKLQILVEAKTNPTYLFAPNVWFDAWITLSSRWDNLYIYQAYIRGISAETFWSGCDEYAFRISNDNKTLSDTGRVWWGIGFPEKDVGEAYGPAIKGASMDFYRNKVDVKYPYNITQLEEQWKLDGIQILISGEVTPPYAYGEGLFGETSGSWAAWGTALVKVDIDLYIIRFVEEEYDPEAQNEADISAGLEEPDMVYIETDYAENTLGSGPWNNLFPSGTKDWLLVIIAVIILMFIIYVVIKIWLLTRPVHMVLEGV